MLLWMTKTFAWILQAKREFLESQSKSSEHSAPVLKSDRNSPDLSDFYAQFLEDSRKSHVQFNLWGFYHIFCSSVIRNFSTRLWLLNIKLSHLERLFAVDQKTTAD